MHSAAKAGHLNVVILLTEGGAGTKFETKDGKVPLCYAAAANHAEVLSFLLTKEHNTENLMEDKKVGLLFLSDSQPLTCKCNYMYIF